MKVLVVLFIAMSVGFTAIANARMLKTTSGNIDYSQLSRVLSSKYKASVEVTHARSSYNPLSSAYVVAFKINNKHSAVCWLKVNDSADYIAPKTVFINGCVSGTSQLDNLLINFQELGLEREY